MKLTAGERRVLVAMRDDPDEEELCQSIPGGWWFGSEQMSGRVGWSLLRKCLLHCTYDDQKSTYFLYRPNEESLLLLNDPTHMTPIWAEWERRYGR